MSKAAIYMRSSKDRKDVSIDAQRRELQQLADSKALEISQEFVDVVESGKDESRPAYQAMLKALSNRSRGWDHLLILDTSRLARREHIASVFHHECKKKGVKILYVRVPEMDPINELIVLSVMRAMDEIHSHTSREKGNAGMAENVRKGYRAGGRAPLGYRLKHVDIGLVRDGRPVLKSALEPDDRADQVREYLQLRCAGIPRAAALKKSALKISASTAIGIEWNALTYAGCTVWNVHREFGPDGYVGGEGKRRPREEWVIKDSTHSAMISREEADVLLNRLENSDVGRAVSAARRAVSDSLLSAVLQAPRTAAPGAAGAIAVALPIALTRRPGIAAASSVRGRWNVRSSSTSPANWRRAPWPRRCIEMPAGRVIDRGARKQVQAELVGLTAKIDRAVEAALNLDDPAPIYRKIDALERDRKGLVREIEELKREEQLQEAATEISLESIRELLGGLADSLESAPAQHRKSVLELLIDKIVLDPVTNQVDLHYRLATGADAGDCLNVASPRGFEPRLPP